MGKWQIVIDDDQWRRSCTINFPEQHPDSLQPLYWGCPPGVGAEAQPCRHDTCQNQFEVIGFLLFHVWWVSLPYMESLFMQQFVFVTSVWWPDEGTVHFNTKSVGAPKKRKAAHACSGWFTVGVASRWARHKPDFVQNLWVGGSDIPTTLPLPLKRSS